MFWFCTISNPNNFNLIQASATELYNFNQDATNKFESENRKLGVTFAATAIH